MLLKPIMTFSGRVAGLATAAALSTLVTACSGDMASTRPAGPPAPPYQARDAQLFDDGAEAKALGFEISDGSGKDAKLLPDRVDVSDGVVRARVVTVTSKAEDSGTGLLLSFQALEALTGHHAPSGDFTLLASARSPSTGLLKAAEGRLVGMTFVVFVRRFAEANDPEGVVHFHLALDDKEEQDRVRAASVAFH